MYRTHTQCRACGSVQLYPVFDLGVQPLANNFIADGQDHAGHAPLKVLFCPECSLGQLSVVVDPQVLYSNYLYVTSQSDTMKSHFNAVLNDIIIERGPGTVLEIGSNDGTLLAFLKSKGMGPVVGIDPAENLSPEASRLGVQTIISVFDKIAAQDAHTILKKVDVIIARHVFCHVDDWLQFIYNIEDISNRDTLVCIEVPYCVDMLEKCEWDTIYHEHTSYLTLKSLKRLLDNTKFRIQRVIRYSIHGGTIMVMLTRSDYPKEPHQSVQAMLDHEIVTADTWRAFAIKASNQAKELTHYVWELRNKGLTVCGFGASAKSTVMITACGFTKDQICFITDTTPQKHGKCTPGTGIPIVPESELMARRPDYAVMFCWNFKDEVLGKHRQYLEEGGHFIIPVPELKVIDEI